MRHRWRKPEDRSYGYHSHAWRWLRVLVLWGSYQERRYFPEMRSSVLYTRRWYNKLCGLVPHRVAAISSRGAWTLVLAGPDKFPVLIYYEGDEEGHER